MTSKDVPRISDQQPLEPIQVPIENELEVMDNAWLNDKSDPFKVKAKSLTIAQAYHEIESLLTKDSFCLETEVWRFVHGYPCEGRLGEDIYLPVIKYRLWCCECKNAHGREVESLEEVVQEVRRVHAPEPVRGEFERQLEGLRDIGELDRHSEQEGGL